MRAPPGRRELQRAASRAPQDPAVHEQLARRLLADQDLAALTTLQPGLDERFPDRPFTHLVAGHAAKAAGDAGMAARRYRRALALRADSGEALYNLVDLGAAAVSGEERQRIAELAADPHLPVPDRVNVLFARARLLEEDAEAEAAFDCYRAANDLAREELARHGLRHDRDAAERQLLADLASWQPPVFDARLPATGLDLTPVFVVGLPRSGTTLVEQILASHPEVRTGGELTLGPAVEHACRDQLGLAAVDPMPPATSPALREALERARERYLDGLFSRGLDARWVVDKLPANVRIAGFLRLLFPEAPIVHCGRDPRAVAWSLYTANFAAHEPWVHDLDDIAAAIRRHERLLAHWRAVLPAPFVEVSYEALVRRPDTEIPALLAACDMPFDPATLTPEKQDRPVFTASHGQVRRAIHTDAIDRWRAQAHHLGHIASPGD